MYPSYPYFTQPMGYPSYQPYQPQQAVQAPRPGGISGRTVGSASEITVQDVPTDGTVAWFPLSDGSAVIGKRWTPDGNILTMRYVAEATDQQPAVDPVAQLDSKVTEVLSILRSFTGGEQ